MKVNQISNYGYFQLNRTNNKRKTPSFGVYCTPYEKTIAKKYMFVKNPENAIRNEISTNGPSYAVVSDILEYIKELHRQEVAKSEQIVNLTSKINTTNSSINSVNHRKGEISNEIEKANAITENKKLRLSKILSREKRRMYVTSQLKDKYLDLHKLDVKTYPNAIMIKGINNIFSRKFIIDYLRKNDPNFMLINFNLIPIKDVKTTIFNIKKLSKSKKEHSLLCIENFRKYTIRTQKTKNFIDDFKPTLSSCAKENNLTILVFESNEEKLDSAIKGDHRFQLKINAEK